MPEINSDHTKLLRDLSTGEEMRLHDLFRELATLWHSKNPDARSKDLASLLGVRPQAVSQWKSGSDPTKRPNWRSIILLCELTRRKIVISPAGIELIHLRRSR